MPLTKTTPCADCGHEAPSTYCPQCGQRQDVDHRDLIVLIRDFFGDFFGFDSKVFISLRWLLFRPGWLTLEYIAGKRTRYVTPLRLYLFFSVFLFLLLSYTSDSARAVGEHTLRMHISGPTEAVGSESVLAKLPYVLLILVPFFAWLLKLSHRRRDVVYMDHLVFALHFHAAGFVVSSLLLLARLALPAALATVWALLFVFWVSLYLYFGQRRIFRQRPLITGVKVLWVGITYGVLALSVSFLAAWWILSRGGGGTLVL